MKNEFLSQDDIDAKVEYLFAHRFNKTLHAYIDISGDLVAGTLLSQIMYWFSDDKNGNQKVRVFRDGHYWIAKRREDWMSEIRISKKQYDCAIKKLTGEIEPTEDEKKENPGNRGKRREKKFDPDKALVEVKTFHFFGVPTTHIRPITENINREILKWKQELERELLFKNDNECSLNSPKGNLVNSPNGNMEITETGNYYNNIYNNKDNITEITNRDYNTDTTVKKAFSKEKVSYKVFSSQSEEKMGEKHLPYNYSLKEFKIFIRDKIFTLAREIDPDISNKDINEISEIIGYFYDRYFRVMGHRHPILRDDVYKSIILSMMNPPGPVDEGDKYNLYAYEDMIDHFFEKDYGKCSGNRTDYKLPYFFSGKVFENLCWKGFYTGFDDPDQRE